MHLWGMLWDVNGGFTFYRDGVQTWQFAGSVGNNLADMILTGTSVTNNSTATPTGLLVDWVRYYQPSTVSVAAGAHAAGLQR
jgi:hypothetical protein